MEKQNEPIIVDVEEGKTYAFCTCGKSTNFPFCTGDHKDSGMVPLVQTMTQNTKVAICACGRSGNGIFCDGSHTKPTEQ